MTQARYRPDLLEGHELVYVMLHSREGESFWYGDGYVNAVSAEQIERTDLSGAIVVAMGCYAIGPMSDACMNAGAAAFVGSTSLTWSGYFWPLGSQRWGQIVVEHLRRGRTLDDAVAAAHRWVLDERPPLTQQKGLWQMVVLGNRFARLAGRYGALGLEGTDDM